MNSCHRFNFPTSHAVGSSDGFGRLDLFVGVAVVGFLGLLSFAAVARTPGESRWMVTLSNMKQLTAALTLYAWDNNGHVENWQWNGERFRRSPGPFWQFDSRPLTTDGELSDLNRLRTVTATR